MFAYHDAADRVALAFTDRHGGVSAEPFSSLNLAQSGGDAPEAVERNLTLALEAFTGDPHAPLVRMHQMHGARVGVVDRSAAGQVVPDSDALVTATPGLVLMVRVADCVPVVLADADKGVVGLAHAGRSGLVAGVVPAAVREMRTLGATDIRAWVGPHVCGRCYEVPAPMCEEVASVVPQARAETSWGTPAVDLGAGVRAQLAAEDVVYVDVARCTLEHEDLYSYRRQGQQAGRLAGLVWVRP